MSLDDHDPFTSAEVRRTSPEIVRRPLVERERDALRQVLQHPWGRLALRAVLRLTGLGDETFLANASQNAFKQGQQSVGVVLTRTLKDISLDHVHAMDREELEDRAEA